MNEARPEPVVEAARLAPGALGMWWRQGARCAFLLRPRWEGLQTTPTSVAWLVAVPYLFGVLIERLFIVGDAGFYWPAIAVGWLTTCGLAWLCWLLLPAPTVGGRLVGPSGPAALFAMMAAQLFTIQIVAACFLVPMARLDLLSVDRLGLIGAWTVWLVPLGWLLVAQAKLAWQSAARGLVARVGAIPMLAALLLVGQLVRPASFWFPVRPSDSVAAAAPLEVTQAVLEEQAAILPSHLAALRGERAGTIDVYSITYSPYADEDVFRRESAMVTKVMEQRFGAEGHTVQLVNHRETIRQLPWATPLNLRRTIEKMATLMNRDEDILFIHLTSHGAHDGVLSTRLWPFDFESLTPAELKTWLDEAKIRYRVISVSACYSGSWIAPLHEDGTLVMTAADADHTSYGCGRGSELTYFGRAMFDEELRRTWSFEEAHAAARLSIDARERAAGKSDGYSNPQIDVGVSIRERLSRLAEQQSRVTAAH